MPIKGAKFGESLVDADSCIGTQPLLPAQYQLDHNCAVNRQLAVNKAAVPVADAGVQFIPECSASGIDYRPLQCLAWDFCACSSAEGRMLTNWTRGLKGCDCLVAQDKAKQGDSRFGEAKILSGREIAVEPDR